MRLTIREIEEAFGFKDDDKMPKCLWESYMDIERQSEAESFSSDHDRPSLRRRSNSLFDAADAEEREAELKAVARRLAAEFEHGPHHDDDEVVVDTDSNRSSAELSPTAGAPTVTNPSGTNTHVNTPRMAEKKLDEDEKQELTKKVLKARGPQVLAADFETFREAQQELITIALTGGALTDCTSQAKLIVDTPQPSILERFGLDYVRGKLLEMQSAPATPHPTPRGTSAVNTPRAVTPRAVTPEAHTPAQSLRRRKVQFDEESEESGHRGRRPPAEDDDPDDEPPQHLEGADTILSSDHSLVRVYSMLFALRWA